jgi:hypothetical protein
MIFLFFMRCIPSILYTLSTLNHQYLGWLATGMVSADFKIKSSKIRCSENISHRRRAQDRQRH